MTVSVGERDALAEAIGAASRAFGATAPNPVVGCAILDRDGRLVTVGHHARAGEAHAEVVALAAAGQRARGGTAVVTLEPCRHTGRTGPCTQALLEAGVRRVVIGVPDPTAAAGGGADQLRAAGVDVEVLPPLDPGAQAASHVARAWLHHARTGTPFVTLKTASTLDGRVAAADGTSRWITGPQARADVHRLRGEVDAVLVGAGTVRTDDPHLAVRHAAGPQPLRVVLDARAEIAASARVLDDAAPTLVVVALGADTTRLTTRGVATVEVPAGPDGRLDLRAMLRSLADEHDVRHVLVEGGPTLAGALVGAGLVDEHLHYLAPALLGAGPAALGPAGVSTIEQIRRLHLSDITPLGADLRLTAIPLEGS